jgi:hypothetical protein
VAPAWPPRPMSPQLRPPGRPPLAPSLPCRAEVGASVPRAPVWPKLRPRSRRTRGEPPSPRPVLGPPLKNGAVATSTRAESACQKVPSKLLWASRASVGVRQSLRACQDRRARRPSQAAQAWPAAQPAAGPIRAPAAPSHRPAPAAAVSECRRVPALPSQARRAQPGSRRPRRRRRRLRSRPLASEPASASRASDLVFVSPARPVPLGRRLAQSHQELGEARRAG